MRCMRPVLAAFVIAGASPALGASGPATKAYAANPSGAGDPQAVTCRPPQRQPGSRLPGPEVCKTNAVWAQYRRDGMDVASDGIHDVQSEKGRSINPVTCNAVGGSGISAGVNFPRSQCSD